MRVKLLRMLIALPILALLSSGAPTAELYPSRAAGQQIDSTLSVRTDEPLSTPNGANITERPVSDVAAGESLFASIIGISSASSTTQYPTAGNWRIECADCPQQFYGMTDRGLRLDDDGHLHIAYGGDHLYYARRDGAQWHYETVDETTNVGTHASLALDRAGRPHISYSASGDLKYAWYDGVTWQVETVDSEESVGYSTSLALDGEGRPHISYCDYTNYDLRYAWYDGTDWQIAIVPRDGRDDVPQYTSLALDGEGHPHIGYLDKSWDWYDLEYAWYDGVNWQVETVDSVGHFGGYTSLALDGAGQPHISYFNQNDSTIKHAWHDGTSWQVETVDSGIEYGSTALVLDGVGQPHITYSWSDGAPWFGDYIVRYAWHDGTSWQVRTVDSHRWWGGKDISLALDRVGQPHIIYMGMYYYYYTRSSDMKYAWYDGADWHVEMVVSGADVGKYASLALDREARPHISYYDDGHKNVRYAWHDGAAWQIEVVDHTGEYAFEYSGYTSLALDSLGQPHIGYYDTVNDDLKYAWRDGVDWQIGIVDSVGPGGGYASLALDRSGQPHISYYGSGGLRYAWYDGMTWYTETVDGGARVGFYTSLVLDESDRPHISYQDAANDDVRYAWYDETAWYTQTVDSEGSTGSHTSLALDKLDRPHISYCDNTNGHLKYAWHDGTSWYTETVDGGGWVGDDTSLALDKLDRPHISYHDWGNEDLKYAWHDGVSWHIETVDSAGAVGRYTSLTLDGWNQPHISYYDATLCDLKYARLMLPSLHLDKQATPTNGLRNNGILIYTLTISGPGLSVRLWDPLPPLVRYIRNSITGTVTPTAVYSRTAHAVMWQGKLPADTTRTIRFQVTPGITGTGSLSLLLPIVNTAWLTDTYSGRSVLAMAIVNGEHVYLPLIARHF